MTIALMINYSKAGDGLRGRESRADYHLVRGYQAFRQFVELDIKLPTEHQCCPLSALAKDEVLNGNVARQNCNRARPALPKIAAAVALWGSAAVSLLIQELQKSIET